jgi:hypothetical protein
VFFPCASSQKTLLSRQCGTLFAAFKSADSFSAFAKNLLAAIWWNIIFYKYAKIKAEPTAICNVESTRSLDHGS